MFPNMIVTYFNLIFYWMSASEVIVDDFVYAFAWISAFPGLLLESSICAGNQDEREEALFVFIYGEAWFLQMTSSPFGSGVPTIFLRPIAARIPLYGGNFFLKYLS
ncbi:uncharacterized protein LOC113326956 [Papaver somniferum]|uniref:uncharacterized protein LOC113326956 n=1 Tax=Papaver somniferum TaxID=3469 RepID=UPI000E704020|nr:uncharacterized protein LOC113326956 [Papaver somniferum]